MLYTVSGDGLEFEQILKTNENSLQAINQDGNHTIYLFLDRFIKDPGPRKFSYDFGSNQIIKTFILGVQIPFASEDFTVNAEGFSLERVRDEFGVKPVSNDKLMSMDLDVFSPCAMGAVINPSTIKNLKCSVIAGAANNQLEKEERDSILLQEI